MGILLGIVIAASAWAAAAQNRIAAGAAALLSIAALIVHTAAKIRTRRAAAESAGSPPGYPGTGSGGDGRDRDGPCALNPVVEDDEERLRSSAVGISFTGASEDSPPDCDSGRAWVLLDEYRALAPQVSTLSRYVMRRSEEAAVQSTESAFSIAEEAKKASSRVTTLLSDLNDGEDSLEGRVAFLSEKLSDFAALVGDLKDVGGNYGKDMARMEELAGQVTDHTAAIQDIAERTGVLSINASIEAARAGESGKGFTVIAQEVRKLSDNTTELTNRIAGVMRDFGDAVSSSTAESRNRLDRVLEAIDGIRRSLFASVEVLMPQVESVSLSVTEAESLTGSISEKLEDVTIWFQTQDTLRQMIEHISDAITELGVRCDDCASTVLSAESKDRARAGLTRRFTTADEWEALGLEAPEGGEDVTLF